ncbi:MAG: hypothetical protein FWG83_02770 [Oscillospiraceae bacterium]|nr:hypothetical protein [Oscillospiraceae bacterium]
MNNTKTTSYGVIVFWIIVFWPVGTYMLVKNLQNSKAAVINGSNAPRNVAFVLLGCAAMTLVTGASDPETREMIGVFILVSIGLAIGGVYLLKVFDDTKKLAVEFKKYLNVVINGKVTNINEIAQSAGVSRDVAEEKLQRMIDLQIFKGAYIDHKAGELVLGAKPIQPDVEYMNIACPNCGAVQNIIKGGNNACDYCDSAL